MTNQVAKQFKIYNLSERFNSRIKDKENKCLNQFEPISFPGYYKYLFNIVRIYVCILI